MLDKLRALGLPVDADEVFSAVTATRDLLLEQADDPSRLRVELLVREDARVDFAEFGAAEGEQADYVVIGDIGAAWSYPLLDRVFRLLHNGAKLVAMHRNRYFQASDGLHMDIGAFVAGLEYVTDSEAIVVGKPSGTFFQLALDSLGVDAAGALMVGDDVRSDVGGALDAGIRAALVRTGKYRSGDETGQGVEPTAVLDSIADLPDWLGHFE